MNISVILNPIVKLFVAIFIGFISAKTGYLKENIRISISKIIVNITLPLMIFTSLIAKELNMDMLKDVGIVVFTSFVVMTVLYFLGILTAKIFKLKEPTKSLHAVLSASGNVGFLGYPLVTAVFGAQARFFSIIYGMVNDILFWTLGVYLINKPTAIRKNENPYKKLLNPNTLAFLIGIPFLVFKIKLPPILNESLSSIGETTTYLSMIFIGMTLATIDVKNILKNASMIAPAVLKMIIAPIIVTFVFITLKVNPLVIGAVVLQIAMPAQTVTSIVAKEADSNEQYAAYYIFFSTVLSLITLPFVYYVVMSLS